MTVQQLCDHHVQERDASRFVSSRVPSNRARVWSSDIWRGTALDRRGGWGLARRGADAEQIASFLPLSRPHIRSDTNMIFRIQGVEVSQWLIATMIPWGCVTRAVVCTASKQFRAPADCEFRRGGGPMTLAALAAKRSARKLWLGTYHGARECPGGDGSGEHVGECRERKCVCQNQLDGISDELV